MHRVWLTSLLGFFSYTLWAQPPQDGDSAGLSGQDVESSLIQPFKAKLANTDKYTARPFLPELDTTNKNVRYRVPTHLLNLDYPEPTLRAAAMPKEKQQEAYPLYVKAGAGFPFQTYLDASFHTQVQKEFRLGADVFHQSGRGNLDNQQFSKNRIGVGGQYDLSGGFAAGGALRFRMDGNHFYGYDEEETREKDSVFQRFTEFGATAFFKNTKLRPSDVDYQAKLDFYTLSDRYESNETGVRLDGYAEKWFNKKNPLRVEAGVWLHSMNDSLSADTIENTRFAAYINPSFTFYSGQFSLKLGANLGANGGFFVLPDVRAELRLFDGKLDVYAGAEGELRANTFRSLGLYNPFITSVMNPQHTQFTSFFGGVRGDVGLLTYEAQVAYNHGVNLPVFLNDTMQEELRFNVLYDTISNFKISGALELRLSKELSVRGVVASNIYRPKNLDKAYHLPTFESNVRALYRLPRFETYAELFIAAGVPYYDRVKKSNETLGGLFDLNLGASFYFDKARRIGGFVELNNIFNNKNQRWNRYPQIGFNALAGVIIKLGADKK